MSLRAYLTLETVVDPFSKNNLSRMTFLNLVSRAHSRGKHVLFLQAQFSGNPVHDLRFDVKGCNYPCDDDDWMRCTSRHFLGTVNTTQAIVYGRCGSVPFSGPKNGTPRIKCSVFSMRVPQESFQAGNIRVWVKPVHLWTSPIGSRLPER